jgi:hypothetical protein
MKIYYISLTICISVGACSNDEGYYDEGYYDEDDYNEADYNEGDYNEEDYNEEDYKEDSEYTQLCYSIV